jgi:hypothetical protein
MLGDLTESTKNQARGCREGSRVSPRSFEWFGVGSGCTCVEKTSSSIDNVILHNCAKTVRCNATQEYSTAVPSISPELSCTSALEWLFRPHEDFHRFSRLESLAALDGCS